MQYVSDVASLMLIEVYRNGDSTRGICGVVRETGVKGW
jgi:hypothetical protein